METALYILHILVCIGLLPIILLQSGKGGGVSATFGGGGGGSVFGSRGASTFLTKLTSASAIIFMCTSLGLSYFSSRSRSVVGDVPAKPAETAPTEVVTSTGAASTSTPAAGAASTASTAPGTEPVEVPAPAGQ